VYREGADCYVQQRLSLDGSFADILPRVTTTEDGDAVSEWATSMHAVGQFLRINDATQASRQSVATADVTAISHRRTAIWPL
jgi:hypothetical protein